MAKEKERLGSRLRPARSVRSTKRLFSESSRRPDRSRKGIASGAPLGHLHVLRLGFVAVLVWSLIYGTDAVGTEALGLAIVTGAYAAVILATEIWKRSWTALHASLTVVALAADGLFLTWVLYVSGGTMSPLRFLVYLHLIAVTLTFTYKAGIAVAFMHSLFLYAIFRAHLSGAIDVPGITTASGIGESGMSLNQTWLFSTLILWLVTLATAPFSSVNERELRRRHVDLEILADMTDELENLRDPHTVAETMLDRVCKSFGFGRGVVLAVEEDELLLLARRGGKEITSVSSRVDALVDRAWDEHEAILVARLDEATDPVLSELLPQGQNLLVAPMFADGQPLGVLVVERGKRAEPLIQRRLISMVMQFASKLWRTPTLLPTSPTGDRSRRHSRAMLPGPAEAARN
jgi:GAF domain